MSLLKSNISRQSQSDAQIYLYDYNQRSMVVIHFEEQLQPGTFEHAIHHLIDNRIDMSVF